MRCLARRHAGAAHARGARAGARLRQPLVLCSKGIEESSGELLHEVAREMCPDAQIAVLSGPTFAHEVAAGPADGGNPGRRGLGSRRAAARADRQPTFRIYVSDDVAGAEIGGAVKNVLAIACGVVEGKGLGQNARAALIARGFAEMTRFGLAYGRAARNARRPVGPRRPGADLLVDQLAQLFARQGHRRGPAGGRAAGRPPDGGRRRVHRAGARPAGARERASTCRSSRRSMRSSSGRVNSR